MESDRPTAVTQFCPQRAPNLASRVLEGEVIIMNPVDSSLFNLNETATAIWLAADGRTTLQEIVERHICPVYEIGFDQALTDAAELAHSLVAHSILMIPGEHAS